MTKKKLMKELLKLRKHARTKADEAKTANKDPLSWQTGRFIAYMEMAERVNDLIKILECEDA